MVRSIAGAGGTGRGHVARLVALVAAAAPVVLLGACGSSDEGGGNGGGTSVPLADVPGMAAEVLCDNIEQCVDPTLFSLFTNGEDCVATNTRQIAEGDFAAIDAAVQDGRVVYRGDLVQDCLDGLAALGCDALASNTVEACNLALQGTVDEGGDCELDEECKGTLYCKANGACPGTCSPREAPGASCELDDQCDDGLVCAQGACVAPGKEGAACNDATPCRFDFLCVGEDDTAGTPGTCKAGSDVFTNTTGQPCDLVGGSWCAAGSHCAAVDVTMQGEVVWECVAAVGSGAACNAAVPDMCPDGEYCDVPQDMIAGTCAPMPVDGEPCVENGFTAQCATGHRCDGGTCRKRQGNGGSCSDDDVCFSDNCTGGVCAPSKACE